MTSRKQASARRLLGFLCGAAAIGLLAAEPALAQSVYVPNGGPIATPNGTTLSVIDASGLTVAGSTISGGTGGILATVSADQSRVYVSDFVQAGTVSVIDTKTNTIISTITVGGYPEFTALSSDNKTLYVANVGFSGANSVSFINTATNTVTSTVTLPTGFIRALALSPDNSTLYVANQTLGTISTINIATQAVTTIVSGLNNPYGMALSADGSRLYASQASGGIAVVNTATKAVVTTVNLGAAANPQQITLSPDGSKLYVADGGINTVSVINTATNTVAATITVGTGPLGIVFSPDGSKAFVTNNTSNTVTVINTATNAVLATLTVGTGPALLGVCSGNGNSLLASGQTFTANSSSALSCTLSPTSVGPVFTGGTLLFNNPGITGTLPITILSQGAIFDTGGNNATLSGTISGTGGLTKNGLGVLTLSGAGTYTGPTQVNAGTLQAGANNVFSAASAYTIASGATLDVNSFSETVSSFQGAGNITLGSGGSLSAGGDNSSTTFSGVISGSGSLTKTGTGTLTLSGANSFTGTTTLSAGNILVTGSAANSSFAVGSGTSLAVTGQTGGVAVASGGTLTGTGKVGSSTVASGGLLIPGNGTTPGSLNVAGNLTLASGSTYSALLTPSAVSSTVVTGTASANGALIVKAAPRAYSFNTSYTVINAVGGVSGSFASLQVTGLSFAFRPKLTYDANDAYLVLAPNALSPLLTNPTTNQRSVAAGIDNAVLNKNVTPTGGFVALYNLSGAQLGAALDQISGQLGPDIADAVAGGFLPFLNTMASQDSVGDNSNMTVADRGGVGSAYDAPLPAQMQAGAMRLWGGAYGGHAGYSADLINGAPALSATNDGLVMGLDTVVPDNDILPTQMTLGASLALGRQFFHAGNGTGSSNDWMVGAYGRMRVLDAGYISASLGVGHHNIKTSRVVTVSGTDILNAKFLAHQFGGRVEAGYHVALDSEHELTPFAALVGEDFQAPAYAESVGAGSGSFALSYGSHNTGIGHGELGARIGQSTVADGETFSEVGTLALVHAFDGTPYTMAAFNALPGSAFVLRGVHAEADTALLGLDLGMKDDGPFSYGVTINAQFGTYTTIVEEMATLGLQL